MCVTVTLKVAGSNFSRRRVFAYSRLIYTFSYCTNKAAFCYVLASVCEATRLLRVKVLEKFFPKIYKGL